MENFIEEYKADLRELNLSELEILDIIIAYVSDSLKDLQKERQKMIVKQLDNLYQITFNLDN